MLFPVGAIVEVTCNDNIKYINAWYEGEVKGHDGRSYLIEYTDYHVKDNRWVDESVIRYPLKREPFGPNSEPKVGDRVEVTASIKKPEPPGWFEATITHVDKATRTVSVAWTNPHCIAQKKPNNIRWNTVRLIARGDGYAAAPPMITATKVSISKAIPAEAKKLFNQIRTKSKTSTNDAFEFQFVTNYNCSTSKSILQTKIVRAIMDGITHENLEVGCIQDEMNPTKRFAFGAEVYGLFAKGDIKKNEVLGVYAGEVRTVGEFEDAITLQNEAEKVYSIDLMYSKKWAQDDPRNCLTVDACEKKNIISYINDYRSGLYDPEDIAQLKRKLEEQLKDVHRKAKYKQCEAKLCERFSWEPREINAEFVEITQDGFPFIVVITTKDVKKGQELLMDYGADFWLTMVPIIERKIDLSNILREHSKKDKKEIQKKNKELRAKDEHIMKLEREVEELKRVLGAHVQPQLASGTTSSSRPPLLLEEAPKELEEPPKELEETPEELEEPPKKKKKVMFSSGTPRGGKKGRPRKIARVKKEIINPEATRHADMLEEPPAEEAVDATQPVEAGDDASPILESTEPPVRSESMSLDSPILSDHTQQDDYLQAFGDPEHDGGYSMELVDGQRRRVIDLTK